VFGLIVFTVAMGGLYGLMAYLAVMRQREFGIRKALGATMVLLCWMLARETSKTLLVGVTLGIGGGVMIGVFLSRPGMNLRLFDPVALFGVASGLYLSGLVGAVLPYLKGMYASSVRLSE
jgi:ABC-type antimicrobial peptide transport system permease subunit